MNTEAQYHIIINQRVFEEMKIFLHSTVHHLEIYFLCAKDQILLIYTVHKGALCTKLLFPCQEDIHFLLMQTGVLLHFLDTKKFFKKTSTGLFRNLYAHIKAY